MVRFESPVRNVEHLGESLPCPDAPTRRFVLITIKWLLLRYDRSRPQSIGRSQPGQAAVDLRRFFVVGVIYEHSAIGNSENRDVKPIGNLKIISLRLGARAIWMRMYDRDYVETPLKTER